MPKNFESKGKKRKKNYYVQFQKKPRTNTLEPGAQGFLITCNNDERRCIREAYNILNEFAEIETSSKKCEEEDVTSETEDDLEKELEELKSGASSETRKFQQLYTGIKSCLFINSKLDPCSIMLKILEDIKAKGKQRTVSTQKMFPVLGTCKAHLDNLRKALKDVIEYVLKNKDVFRTDDKLQYAILFKARHNNSLKKDEVVTTVIDMVRTEGISWEPEPRTPDCAISIDLLSSICCISVLPDYKKYKRYNLIELAKTEPTSEENNLIEKANTGVGDSKSSDVQDQVADKEGTETS